jgi:hypothetical protein
MVRVLFESAAFGLVVSFEEGFRCGGVLSCLLAGIGVGFVEENRKLGLWGVSFWVGRDLGVCFGVFGQEKCIGGNCGVSVVSDMGLCCSLGLRRP